MRKIVIVGGVAGGATVAARLRRLDEKAEIVLFERGEYISFANCGLPYYIGDVIKDREELLLQTVAEMSKKFKIDIRDLSEVISVNPDSSEVIVKNLRTKEEYAEKYDELILSPGANPIRPKIDGIENAKNIFTLRNVPDTDKIKNYIDENKPKEAVVVGGGFIGIEMAENLSENGIKVHLVEMSSQIMAPLDFEMAQIIHKHLEDNGVNLILNNGVKSFKDNGKTIVLENGEEIKSDLTVLSIGVKPENSLALSAGLELGDRGHIKVNENLETSKPHIYAIGDAIETKDLIFSRETSLALASPANRQARVLADRLCGIENKYKGFLGTSVAKVFDLTVSSTGYNEKTLKKLGITNYKTIHTHPLSNAGYYPDAETIDMKFIFEVPSGKILGAQAVGSKGVEKRIDIIAASILGKLTVRDLQDLELAYAPPFSSAKDPVNMLGYVATNIIDGIVKTIRVDEINEITKNGGILIDVREKEEFEVENIEGSKNIPLAEIRNRLNEIPKDKKIYLTCQVGIRAYNGTRILKQLGFDVTNLDGGFRSYKQLYYKKSKNNCESICSTEKNETMNNPQEKIDLTNRKVTQIDARSLQCPGPIVKVYKALEEIEKGDLVEVITKDLGFKNDISSWCNRMGHKLLEVSTDKNKIVKAVIQKSGASISDSNNTNSQNNLTVEKKEEATMVVFSGDLDKAIASFIIATGAASMGKKVTLFFTFWGLNILRKESVNVKKNLLETMFSKMMPKGVNKLKISKMNMGGMGTKMIKYIMKEKNVDSLQELMERAQEMGVKFVACSMSMDVMGIKKEELIDNVEVGGVATYLSDAENSNLNLFI